ncbi:GtrA family protein [Puerhibacterium sp. TATVAM-FAB25]|uniref:GtrA family protein n=1 Tax=Puerhibacterium sp. TATVAM-FAB25 TaxID=3093699 RepID=UPI00397C507B
MSIQAPVATTTSAPTSGPTPGPARGPRQHPTTPRARGAGWRFGAIGVASSVLYGLVVGALGLAPAVSAQAAHLVATAVSTVTGSALHRGFTFRATHAASWRRSQVAGGGTALLGMGMSTMALTLWQHAMPHSGRLGNVVLVYAVNGLMGLVNFFVMRRVLRAGPAAGREPARA